MRASRSSSAYSSCDNANDVAGAAPRSAIGSVGAIATASDMGGGESIDERRRRIVGDKVPNELGRQAARRRRVDRKIGEHGACLRFAGLGVAAAEQRAVAGFVPAGLKDECAIGCLDVDRAADEATDAPSGQRPREFEDVGLALAAAGARRVQLEGFTAGVFVDTGPAASAAPIAEAGPIDCAWSR